MRTRIGLLVVSIMLVALTACQTEGGPTPPQPAPSPEPTELEATTDGSEAVTEYRLLPGEEIVFAIRVPREREGALFLEVDKEGLAVQVFNPDETFFAESLSPKFFQGRDRTQAAASEHLSTQAVITPTQCRGACVIRRTRAQGEVVFVVIENTTNSPITFNLYAYTRAFDDENEPVNNRREDAIPFDRAASGALETLEDQDWFEVTRTGTLFFTAQADSPIGHRAAVFSPGATSPRRIIEPGDSVPVIAGDRLQVYADPELNRAGPASTSRYSFEVQ